MKSENNTNSGYLEKTKPLLSNSVGKKFSKVDTEKVLYDFLYPKFGERFLEYRKKYETYLTDNEHKSLPSFPVSLILELVNRCNLECVMCWQGYRNDTEKSAMDINVLKKLFSETEMILIQEPYNKNRAIRTKTDVTATDPHNTNLVKIAQVSLWSLLSIKIISVWL